MDNNISNQELSLGMYFAKSILVAINQHTHDENAARNILGYAISTLKLKSHWFASGFIAAFIDFIITSFEGALNLANWHLPQLQNIDASEYLLTMQPPSGVNLDV